MSQRGRPVTRGRTFPTQRWFRQALLPRGIARYRCDGMPPSGRRRLSAIADACSLFVPPWCLQNAAGWAEDPTGGFERNPAFSVSARWRCSSILSDCSWGRLLGVLCVIVSRCPPQLLLQGGVGARTPISLAQCAVACQGAKGCEAFTYNTVQRGCFLKTGQCPLRNNCQVRLGGSAAMAPAAAASPSCLPPLPYLPSPPAGLPVYLPRARKPVLSSPCTPVQPPDLTCTSTSDTGKTLSTPCGTWSTWWRREGVWDSKDAACARAAGGGGGGTVASFSREGHAGR